MIFTSYFANIKNIKHKKLISISRFTPKWLPDIQEAKELAPSTKLLEDYKKGLVDDDTYIERYHKETLSKLNRKLIYEKYNNSVFLCYEKHGDFCHRQIVSDWLSEENFKIKEIKPMKTAIIIDIKYSEEDFKLFSFILNKFIDKNPHIEVLSRENIFIKTFSEKYGLKFKYIGDQENIWCLVDNGIIFTNKQIEENMQLSYMEDKKCFIFNVREKCFIPRVIKGNILDSKASVIGFTANSITKKNGALVMGAGCAKAFKEAFKDIDFEFGNIDQNFGWKVIEFENRLIGAFQTKINYRNKSTLEIIKNSILKLKKDIKNYDSIALCMPGVLNGGLNKEEVLPLFNGVSIDLFLKINSKRK